MTIPGSGGVQFAAWEYTVQFQRQFKKLDPQLQRRTKERIEQLLQNPIPAGLRFEKLRAPHDPPVYTIHVDGNYKVSLQLEPHESGASRALLRKVGTHNEIDRSP